MATSISGNPTLPLTSAPASGTTAPADKAALPAQPTSAAQSDMIPTSPASALRRPTSAMALQSATYPGHPANLREAFDAIPGGGVASVRQFSGNVTSWASSWDILNRAKYTIDTQYFTIERDIFGFSFLGAILRKQRQDVKCRVMTDALADVAGKHGFTHHLTGRDYMQELVSAGVEAAFFHPTPLHLIHLPVALMFPSSKIAASNHQKILSIDVAHEDLAIGKTGGRNEGRDYYVDERDLAGAWRDGDAEIRGQVPARSLTTAFEREFNSNIAKRVRSDLFGNWVKRDVELLGAYHLMNLWMHDPVLTEDEATALRDDPARRAAEADKLVKRALAALSTDPDDRVRITRTPSRRELKFLKEKATELVGYPHTRGASNAYDRNANFNDAEVRVINQTSSASGRYNEIAPALTSLVRGAQKRILIENPYVVLTEDEIKELEAASKRGVEILFGTNSPLSTDSATTQAFFLEDWPYILARIPTARFFVATGERKLHAKMAVVDDQVSLVSSYNADWLSGYVNSEVGAVVWSQEFARDLSSSFIADFNNPTNGVLEYTIKRNADGSAVLENHGTESAPKWRPVVTFGPDNHVPDKIMRKYGLRRKLWNFGRKVLPPLEPLRRPPLTYPAARPGTPAVSTPSFTLRMQ